MDFEVINYHDMMSWYSDDTPDELKNGATYELDPETQKWLDEIEAKHR